jgi:predicted RNase H-like nuclease (RuvC/YqgF family)
VKAQVSERESWNCDKCRAEKVRMLQTDLQNALRHIDELKARNRELEAKLLLAVPGKRDTVFAKQKFTKNVVVSDSL